MNYEIIRHVLKPAKERIYTYTNNQFYQTDIELEDYDNLFWINSHITSKNRWRQEINTVAETVVIYRTIKSKHPHSTTDQLIHGLLKCKKAKELINKLTKEK